MVADTKNIKTGLQLLTEVPIVSNIPDEDQDDTVDDPTEIAGSSCDYVSSSEDDSSDEDASSDSS